MTDEQQTDVADEGVAPDDRPVSVVRLVDRFGDAVLSVDSFRGEWTIVVERRRLVEALTLLKDDPGLEYARLVDVTAVDCLEMEDVRSLYDGARFMVVYHLYSHRHQGDPALRRLRVKTPVLENDPIVPTEDGLWASANWAEREVFDMFGIRFEGHPDMRRILMPDEFEDHPLRKDYPLRGRGERASFDFEKSPSHSVLQTGDTTD